MDQADGNTRAMLAKNPAPERALADAEQKASQLETAKVRLEQEWEEADARLHI